MKRAVPILIALLLALSALACTISVPALPSIDVPRLQVGEMQEYTHQVPRAGVTEAEVDVVMGAGEITVAAGDSANFFSGVFRTNIAEWAPEVSWDGSELSVTQAGAEGMPDAGAENHWTLAFAPDVPMEMTMRIGAGDGDLDFSGLSLSELLVETGAADLEVGFDEPNPVRMTDLTVRTGASNLRVEGIGNAGPDSVTVEAGAGNLVLNFVGAWPQSARVHVTIGTGAVTLRFPQEVGVRVQMEGGMGNVRAGSGFRESDGAYVNDTYDTASIQLDVTVEVGVGTVSIEQIGE